MRKTTNYGLVLYDTTDKMSITGSTNSLNASMEIIDSKLKEISDAGGSGLTFEYVTEQIETEIPCTDITLDPTTLTFNGNGQQSISVTLTPSNTTDIVMWQTSNNAVAVVSQGNVTAIGNGECTITVTCGEISATCEVSVSGITETIAVTGVSMSQSTASVNVGETITLEATIEPTNATNQNVSWTSDNEPIATVVNGVVTGVSAGTASIGVMTQDGGYSATCNVTVNEVVTSQYRNLFDKDTMVTANQGITGQGAIGSHAWGLARVPVQENTQYSVQTIANGTSKEQTYYTGALAGAFGFADSTGNTIISRLSFADSQAIVDAGTNGANALLSDYSAKGGMTAGNIGWVTFTTPAGCSYLLFNTTLKVNQVQVEEGDTIHDYYLPYVGGEE